MSWHWHRWTLWGEPFEADVMLVDTWKGRALGRGVAQYQRRTCRTCGKIQERGLKD